MVSHCVSAVTVFTSQYHCILGGRVFDLVLYGNMVCGRQCQHFAYHEQVIAKYNKENVAAFEYNVSLYPLIFRCSTI